MSRHHVVCLAEKNSAVLDLEVEREILAAVDADITLEFYEDGQHFSRARNADAILHRGGLLDSTRIAQLQNCRIIAHAGIGFDSIDLGAATSQDIFVTNVAEYCIDEVSTHALSLLLALHRRLIPYSRQTRAGRWASQGSGSIERLSAMTVAVVGYGRIGSAFGRKAHHLGLRVLAVDPLGDRLDSSQQGVRFLELREALEAADFVSLHVPLNSGTRGMIGSDELASMKPGAFVINTSRGGIIDESALIDALRAGRIAGAGIDVLASEPPEPNNPLLQMGNVIVTPHAAYYSTDAVLEVRRITATQIADTLRGGWPIYLLNSELMLPHSRITAHG